MFRRNKPLLSKKEANNLWGFWWASARTSAHILTTTDQRPDFSQWVAFGAESCDIIDEFYDAIVWLETL